MNNLSEGPGSVTNGTLVLGFAWGAFAGGSGGRHEAFGVLAVGIEEAAEFFHGGQGDEGGGEEECMSHAGGGDFTPMPSL